jgi:hypothetical protein
MTQVKITLEGPDRLKVFVDLVDLLKKPNVKLNLKIEDDEGLAFLISPEASFEVRTR